MNDTIEGPQGCHFGVECNKAGFCKLGQVTGITCPNDSCDIEDGIRSLPVSAVIKAATECPECKPGAPCLSCTVEKYPPGNAGFRRS